MNDLFTITINGVDLSCSVRSIGANYGEPKKERPADCPHHPTSPAGRAWIRDHCMKPDAADRAAADARIESLGLGTPRWGALHAASSTPDPSDPEYLDHLDDVPTRRAGNIQIASAGAVSGLSSLFEQAIKEAEQVTEKRAQAMALLSRYSTGYTAAIDQSGRLMHLTGITHSDPETHVIRGRPAGRVHNCHHGNPKGQCKPCSTH